MVPLDITKIKAEVDEIIAMEPTSIETESGDLCTGDGWHSNQCQLMMEHESKPCILEQTATARLRQKRLMILDLLTKCTRNPSEANGHRLLDGMATDSCIYEVE